MTVMRVGVAATILLAAATPAMSQAVRVRLVDGQASPVPGALVSLRLAGTTLQQRVSGPDGSRLMPAPPSRGYTVEVRRVGFEPVVSAAFAITAADTHELAVVVGARRASLPRLPTGRDAACRPGASGLARTGTWWEQARTALESAEIVRTESLEPLAIRRSERTLGTDGVVRAEAPLSGTARGSRPFVGAQPEDLARNGYSVNDSLGQVIFRAPDAAVLLSDEFVRDHCWSLVAGADATAGMVGLRFAPMPGRVVTDVEGALWLDAATAQLRLVEFRYRLPRAPDLPDIGGRILFEQLASAHWIAREWVVRAPVMTQLGQVLGYREELGEAMSVSPRMQYVLDSIANSRKVPGLVTGVVMDSLSGAPFAGATVWLDSAGPPVRTDARGVFFLRGVVPGEHVVQFSHPLLDSLGIRPRAALVNVVSEQMSDARLAGPSLRTLTGGACGDSLAIVTGKVRDVTTGAPVDSVDVTLSWMEVALDDERRPLRISPVDVVARTSADGSYAACVTAGYEITVTASRGIARSGGVDITTESRRLGILNLSVDLSATDSTRGAAELRGVVRYQDGTPLRNAIITLTEPELAATTDSAGAFRLRNIPGGTRVFDTRAIGHAPVRTIAEVTPGDTTPVTVYLRKVTQLDAVIVQAAASDRTAETLQDLADRRKKRVGHRVTPSQMANFRNSRIDAVLRSIPSATLRLNPTPMLTIQDAGGRECTPIVFLDGHRSHLMTVVNLRAADVLSVEVMRLREVPVEFQNFSNCGVVLVWMKPASMGRGER